MQIRDDQPKTEEPAATAAAEEDPETAIFRRPYWTVRANLKRHEKTDWVGQSVEFFDDEQEAQNCFDRHRENGDSPTKRPFHSVDESYMHVLDTRKQ